MKPLLLLLLAGCAFGQQGGGTGTVTSTNMESDQDCITTQTPVMMGRLLMSMPRTDCKPTRHVDVVIIASDQKPAPKKPAKKYCVLTVKGKCAGYVTKDEPCIVTNGTEKGVTSKPCPTAKPVIKKCSGLTGECEVESTGTSKWAVLQSPQFIPDIRIDVPAIQEIANYPPDCSMSYLSQAPKDGWLQDWTANTGMVCRPKRPLVWGCKDKTRGFWHDEQEPPKRWCRRVQP